MYIGEKWQKRWGKWICGRVSCNKAKETGDTRYSECNCLAVFSFVRDIFFLMCMFPLPGWLFRDRGTNKEGKHQLLLAQYRNSIETDHLFHCSYYSAEEVEDKGHVSGELVFCFITTRDCNCFPFVKIIQLAFNDWYSVRMGSLRLLWQGRWAPTVFWQGLTNHFEQ